MTDPRAGSTDHYSGAGDGQCLAMTDGEGERCQNGVGGSDLICGLHKNADGVEMAHENSDRDFYWCPHCGFQPFAWNGDVELCQLCGLQFPPPVNEGVLRYVEPDDEFRVVPVGEDGEEMRAELIQDEEVADDAE